MSDIPTVNWAGGSGKTYKYYIHDIDWEPAPNQDGNYIFAKQVSNGWHAVYVGQGDLKKRKAAALDEGCVTRKGATHYHEHLNGTKASRTAEESDVLDGNQEAYTPSGCNEKEGG